MKGWIKITLLIVLIFIAVGSFYYLTFSSFIKGAPAIGRESYLQLDIYGEIPERESVSPFAKLFGAESPSMEGLLQCIRKAKIDPKIVGIILRPFPGGIGWAKLDELRQALLDFKESGKPVYVYLEVAGNREYYLSLTGDMIFGSPTGNLFINGLLAEAYFFRNTLDKIGVQADFIAHGKYKNAPDIFTRDKMSDAQREVVNALLNDYHSRYQSSIASARQLSGSKVASLLNQGLFTLEEAYQEHLIDTLLYYNEFKDYLKAKDGHRLRLVSYGRYKKVPFNKLGIKARETFALIYGLGDIVNGLGDDFVQENMITSQGMAENIRKAARNKQVKAIILRINSPGGSGSASDIIWREVVEARKKKPVIVSMSDVAASGGYYISMAADSIVAQPGSIVGSIGVFAGKFSFKGLYRKLGINKEEIKRSRNADLFSENKLFTPGQRELLKKYIDDFYRIFVQKVAQSRHKSYEEIDRIAQGRVWTGKQGMEVGLVDRLGGLQDAIRIAKKMTGIPADQYVRVLVYPKKRSLLERLLDDGLSAKYRAIVDLIPLPVRNYLSAFLYFRDYEALTMMPFYLDIH